MSITKVSDFAVGDIDLTAMMNTLNKAYKSQAAVTLSNYDNDSAPVVKVGSVFDNNGTQYAVTGTDETPTGYSGISNSTTFYLYFDESAEAFIYDSTAPSWSDDLQGWYNGNDRALFSMYKDSGGTLYQKKSFLINQSEKQVYDLTVNNNLSINSITLNKISDRTTISLSASSSWTVPDGLYLIIVPGATNDIKLNIYSVADGNWVGSYLYGGSGLVVGDNGYVKVQNLSSSSSYLLYYKKVG